MEVLNVLEFRAAMVRKGFSQKELAKHLGISEKTLCSRIKNKRFGTDEIERLIPLLEINDPMQIFFEGVVTCKVPEPADQICDALGVTPNDLFGITPSEQKGELT